jgi:cold shock protein
MPRGTVKWFDGEKGYGFVSPDEGGEDGFVHHTGIAGSGVKTLDEGEKVIYEVAQGRRGPQAQNVSRVPEEPGFWEVTYDGAGRSGSGGPHPGRAIRP